MGLVFHFGYISPLKNISDNGVVSAVENSRMLLIDFCRFSGKFLTMFSVTRFKISSTKGTLKLVKKNV